MRGLDLSTDRDSRIMKRALELARLAEGRTSPNPMVGAVVVRDGQIVGEGYHRKAGCRHAEIEALRAAGEKAKRATIYVTLEPCCRQGRTPPCTDALIEAGVAEVVYAVRDPNPKIDGRGQARLESAGIRVRTGVCSHEAEKLIRPFHKFSTRGLPFVTVKFAMTLDGKIATRTGHSRWISSPESRRYTHKLRNLTDVIMVGAGTVIIDDPRLTTRIEGEERHHPLRIVVDSRGRANIDAQIFSASLPGQSVLATTDKTSVAHCAELEGKGVAIWRLTSDSNERVDLLALLRRVAAEEMLTVLVEGGSGLLGSFFEQHLVDRALVSVAPKVIGGFDAPSPVGGFGVSVLGEALEFHELETEMLGADVWIRAEKPRRSANGDSGRRADD